MHPEVSFLLVLVAVLLGAVAAFAATPLARSAGVGYAEAIGRGGAAFVATVTLVVLVMTATGVLPVR